GTGSPLIVRSCTTRGGEKMICLRRVCALGLVGYCLVLDTAGCGGSRPGSDSARPATSASVGSTAARTPGPGNHALTMMWSNKERAYTVHAPPGYPSTRLTPVVIVMHDRGGSAQTMQQMTGLDAKADQVGFLVVYLNGVDGAFNALICCGNDDDVGYVKALVACLIRD